MVYDAQKKVLQEMALALKEVILPWYSNRDLPVELKPDETPVSFADKEAEKVLREIIGRRFPDDGIIGEEFGEQAGTSGYCWMLDPIDGTKTFIRSCPLFGSLIALLEEGEPVLGLIYNPVLNMYCLGDGRTAEINGSRVKMREISSISKATVLCSDIKLVAQFQRKGPFEELVNSCELFRTWGDCYGYMLAAQGHADVMLDPIMNPWDTMALIPIIRGAGGMITDWEGNNPVVGNSVIAAADGIHAEVVRVLNSR